MIKILVASPTAEVKEYCMDEWVGNTSNLTYKNYDMYIADNSDSRDFMDRSNKKYGDVLTMERLSPTQYKSVRGVMAKSHDRCRIKALEGGYDFLLHLETDIFPPKDVIERLLESKKGIIGCLYHIELGEESKLMIQQIEGFGKAHRETYNLDINDMDFINGEVKQVFSCGLGCTLIHRSVLEKIEFRYEEGATVHPDSFFFNDVHQLGYSVFVDTSILCEHKNKSWSRI